MKVKELISVLNKLDPDKEVFTNICYESYYNTVEDYTGKYSDKCIEYKDTADHAWLDEDGDLVIGITVRHNDGKQMLI